ncbi:MAG: PIG-L family deacetylase [Candidatus Thermoplasmatota archaeon]|nr:PIG-L family deacetylase [Candidatus Thermoplasmatota archaeon]
MDFSTYLKKIELDETRRDIMMQSKRIISFAPHPDDNEIVAGGFIARKIQDGAEFQLVVASDGRKGSRTIGEEDLKALRKVEQENALQILGSRNIRFLGYRDSEVPNPSSLRKDIIDAIREFSPDLVITVDPYLPYEAHTDHVNTGMSVLQAVLFGEFPSMGEGKPVRSPNVALGLTYNPNVIVDCTPTMEKKVTAIKAHASQFPDESSIDLIKGISSLYGQRIGSQYAEPFRMLMPHELHVNVLGGMNPW